jgi:hypothetical protein
MYNSRYYTEIMVKERERTLKSNETSARLKPA